LFCIGNAFMIIAFQTPVPEGEKTPELIYDLLFSGIALFMTAPFVMIVGLCRKFKNHLLSFCRIPSAIGSYFTLFNACKEIAGLNNDYSTTQLVVFLIGMTLTLVIQYEYHRIHINN
jgi:hypothetical protein